MRGCAGGGISIRNCRYATISQTSHALGDEDPCDFFSRPQPRSRVGFLFKVSDLNPRSVCSVESGILQLAGVRPVQTPDRCGDRRMTARGRSPSPPAVRSIHPARFVFEGLGACAIGVKFWMRLRRNGARVWGSAASRSVSVRSRPLGVQTATPTKAVTCRGELASSLSPPSPPPRPGLRVPGISASWSHNMYGMRKPFMK